MQLLSKRGLTAFAIASTLIGTLGLASTAFAAGPGGFGHGGMHAGVMGTVASVSGTTLTVTAKNRPHNEGPTTTTPVTYTVDASTATVTKDGTSSTISAIVVGDTVMVQGTVTGTNIVATQIRDGKGMSHPVGTKPEVPAITGNGQPVIGGKVTAITGTTLTVTNTSNVTYTVNAASATILKKGVTSATVASIVVGDNVIVQGTVNGTTVAASSVIDQAAGVGTTPHAGFFGGLGGFFSHLFGFF